MKITKCTLIVIMAIAVITGCKKDEDNPQPEPADKFANIFLVKEIFKLDDGTERQYDYIYDSLGRIKTASNMNFFYNSDGTLKRMEASSNYLKFHYDNQKRIVKLVYFIHQVGEPDTIQLFYSSSNKPDSAYHWLYGWRERFQYWPNGLIKRIDLITPGLEGYETFEWENGNLVKLEQQGVSYHYEFDDKPNFAKAMHLPKEFSLAVELRMDPFGESELIMQNNLIKTTQIIDQQEPVLLEYPVLEYNQAGLPTKKRETFYGTTSFVYEERL